MTRLLMIEENFYIKIISVICTLFSVQFVQFVNLLSKLKQYLPINKTSCNNSILLATAISISNVITFS